MDLVWSDLKREPVKAPNGIPNILARASVRHKALGKTHLRATS